MFKKIKQSFKSLKDAMNPGSSPIAMSSNRTSIGYSPKGIVDYDPNNVTYSEGSGTASSGKGISFDVYPEDNRDSQEHYMLFDVIQRTDKNNLADGHPLEQGSFAANVSNQISNPGATVNSKRLNTLIYGANRFFGEGGAIGVFSNRGAPRTVVNTMAIYMPQTLKFNLSADYGPAEIGVGLGALKSASDFFRSGFDTSNLVGGLSQVGKGIMGVTNFFTAGLGSGVSAALQRRTGIAPAAMTEMIFNGIDYRQFSFEFKFTPRTKSESDIVRRMIDRFKFAMLPEKFGTNSIAAYKVPYEFVIRFMKGTQVNPYIEQLGLCALTDVATDFGDKYSTHTHGDPVTTNLTLTFRELELIEKKRYRELNPLQ